MGNGERKDGLIWTLGGRPPPTLLKQWLQTGVSRASRIFVWHIVLWDCLAARCCALHLACFRHFFVTC